MLRSSSTLSMLAAVLALLGSACGGSAPQEAAGSDPNARGYRLYQRGTCHTCHGPQLAGSQLGPALRNLEEHWDEDRLVELLLDPQAFIDGDPRLRELRGMYIMRMPPAPRSGLSREEIRELAGWLLSDDREP